MRRRGIIAVGGRLTVAVPAALVGGDRWRRQARELDQRSSLVSPRGSRLYGRVAPRILRGFYRRVANDVVSVLSRASLLAIAMLAALSAGMMHPAFAVSLATSTRGAVRCPLDRCGGALLHDHGTLVIRRARGTTTCPPEVARNSLLGVALTLPPRWPEAGPHQSPPGVLDLQIPAPPRRPANNERLIIASWGTTPDGNEARTAAVEADALVRASKGRGPMIRIPVHYGGAPGVLIRGLPGKGPVTVIILVHARAVYTILAPARTWPWTSAGLSPACASSHGSGRSHRQCHLTPTCVCRHHRRSLSRRSQPDEVGPSPSGPRAAAIGPTRWSNCLVASRPGGGGTETIPGIEVQPHSPSVAQGVAYPFTLDTHCGVGFTVDVDGAFWDLADAAWAGSNGNPPPRIGNPCQKGTMTLVDRNQARFDFTGGHNRFTRQLGRKVSPGACS